MNKKSTNTSSYDFIKVSHWNIYIEGITYKPRQKFEHPILIRLDSIISIGFVIGKTYYGGKFVNNEPLYSIALSDKRTIYVEESTAKKIESLLNIYVL